MTAPDPIAKAIEAYVNADEIAGAVTLVWKGGQIVQCAPVGWRDREALEPMARDSIFRIASMSKPVTSLAAMILMEQGAFALDDPITEAAPEFADMRVLRAIGGPLDDTDPAERSITFRDLLTHRSGLTYGGTVPGPHSEACLTTLGGHIDGHLSPDAWIAALAALPLIDQPGAGFHYGHSTDLLGLLIARMDGAPLAEVLRRRIFAPLGMKDTGFVCPPEKHLRRAQMYGFDAKGAIIPRPDGNGGAGAFKIDRTDEGGYVSGGQGLWSTVDDYLAFARLFVEGGEVDGVRLLKPETIALLMSDQLTPQQRISGEMLGMPAFTAHGFGLGLAVVLDPAAAMVVRCRGGVGTVGWPGAYGGWWQADPTESSVMIFLAHNIFDLEQLAQGVGLGVYGAITAFHGAASALTCKS